MPNEADRKPADGPVATAQRACIACAAPISATATLCASCKTYQVPWKARLQFISPLTALIVGGLSLMAWSATQVPKIRETFFPRQQAEVIAANTMHGGVVANTGDREVFISHIIVFMKRPAPWVAPRFPIAEALAPGKFLRFVAPGPAPFSNGFWVRGVPAAEWSPVLDKALRNGECAVPVFFVASDPLYRELVAMAGPKLNTFEASGYLEYRSISEPESRKTSLDVRGVLFAKESPECVARLGIQ